MVPMRLLAFFSMTSPMSGLDWRHLDPYLPFEEIHLHPSKSFVPLDTRKLHGMKIGVPLQFGWAASRLGELGSQAGAELPGQPSVRVDYVQHSTGMYCANDGHPFDPVIDPEHCLFLKNISYQ